MQDYHIRNVWSYVVVCVHNNKTVVRTLSSTDSDEKARISVRTLDCTLNKLFTITTAILWYICIRPYVLLSVENDCVPIYTCTLHSDHMLCWTVYVHCYSHWYIFEAGHSMHERALQVL